MVALVKPRRLATSSRKIHLHAIGILAPVAMYVQGSWSVLEQLDHLLAQMPQDVLVIAGKPDFDGRLLDGALLQFAQEDAGFRSRFARGGGAAL